MNVRRTKKIENKGGKLWAKGSKNSFALLINSKETGTFAKPLLKAHRNSSDHLTKVL